MNLIILITCFLTGASAFASVACLLPEEPQALTAMRANIDKKTEILANSKFVATQADTLLSKLMAAKSPIINSWLNNRSLDKKSDEEIIKAWRKYYTQNFVLTKYPQEDFEINAAVEKFVDQAIREHLNSKFKKRLEKLFAIVQKAAIETVRSFEIENAPTILARIKMIRLYWPKNLKMARNNLNPKDIINWGIAYDPVPNEINIGLEALAYGDDQIYLAVLAHEIGHSFDSCRWGAFFNGKWPFEKVGECLRSDQSVAAKKRDDSQLAGLQKTGKISTDLMTGLQTNPTCNKLIYPPPGIQADQLSESFADWFSAEVLARLKELITFPVRADLCEDSRLTDGSSYPSNLDRLQRIYLVQPKFRALVKENSTLTAKYCAIK